jgi:hypothetical protein
MDINESSIILPPSDLVNPSNSHFTNPLPQFTSKVGAVVGYTGSINSPLALEGKGVYETYKGGKIKKSKRKHIGRKMSKGKSMSKRSMSKRSMAKRSMSKRSMSKRSMAKRRKTRKGGYSSSDHQVKVLKQSSNISNREPYAPNRDKKRSSKKRGGGLFKGYVAFTPSYNVDVNSPMAAKDSALANPPPIKRTNDCLNTWKHLGSETKPYNKVWN